MSEDRTCHLYEWSMQEQLDNVLADEGSETLEAHLAECDGCAAKFASLKFLYSEMEHLPDEPLMYDLSAKVVRSLKLRKDKKLYVPQVLAAELITAAVVFFTIWPRISLELGSRYSLVQILGPLRIFMDLSARGIHSAREVLLVIHTQWIATLSMPAIDWPITGLPLALVVGAMILLWLLGNGFLLREPANGHIQ